MENIKSSIVELLIKRGMEPSKAKNVGETIQHDIENVDPPRIALIGLTGVGKSSTINALFNAGQPIDNVCACTQEANEINGDVSKYTGSKGSIIIYDMPGLGESISRDKQHYETYSKVIPKVDAIVWILHASDRSMEPMQRALMSLSNEHKGFDKKLMFAINKADATHPGETFWKSEINVPSKEQTENINKFEEYVKSHIHEVLPKWNGDIITYSAKKRYRLDQLILAMIKVMPKDRAWVLEDRADVADYIEFIDKKYIDMISKHD